MGIPCRYDGREKTDEGVTGLIGRHTLVPFCPEIYGGLPTPREPAERVGDSVQTRSGADVTAQYEKGAEAALRVALLLGCRCAILQDRSPSCGVDRIHDGTFQGGMVDGDGVTARLLRKNGVRVYNASQIDRFLSENPSP